MYTTDNHSLEFWLRLQSRLAAAFEDGRKKLAEYRSMVFPAGVNDAKLMTDRARGARADALKLLDDLSNLRLLMLSLESQLALASSRVELPYLEQQIACLRDAVDLLRSSVCGLPQRQPGEDDLNGFVSQYEAVRNAGNGDHAMNERQRLRDQCVSLRVLGREDGSLYEDECRTFETQLDHLATQVLHLKASTQLALTLPELAAQALVSFGVQLYVAQVQTPALPAPADDAQKGIAAGTPSDGAEASAQPAETVDAGKGDAAAAGEPVAQPAPDAAPAQG
jgi:hypothetical protein